MLSDERMTKFTFRGQTRTRRSALKYATLQCQTHRLWPLRRLHKFESKAEAGEGILKKGEEGMTTTMQQIFSSSWLDTNLAVQFRKFVFAFIQMFTLVSKSLTPILTLSWNVKTVFLVMLLLLGKHCVTVLPSGYRLCRSLHLEQ